MKKRIKDLAYTLKIDKDLLIKLSSSLDLDERKFYRNWDEPKTDEKNNQDLKMELL